MPPPTPPSVNDGRMMHGKPDAPRPPPSASSIERDVAALGHLDADLTHRLVELQPVLGDLDRLDRRADQLDAVLLEHAVLAELDGEVERRLAADRRQHRVGPLALDDLLEHFRRQRLDVGPVGQLRVGHDRRRVAVDQDDLEPLVAQRLARLRAGVVELAGLPDDDRAGADDENALDVGAFGHRSVQASVLLGLVTPRFLHLVEELPEQVVRVVRAGRGLGMVLHAEDRLRLVAQAFDGAVVQVDVRHLDVAPAATPGRPRSRGSAT